MPNYRRVYVPGAIVFLTMVTHRRRPVFATRTAVDTVRETLRRERAEHPFEIVAGVVLPDHIHMLWKMPEGDTDYSSRIGRWKRGVAKALRACAAESVGAPLWQRRFWEHTIRDPRDLERHVDYIHYNPVKHGLVSCPHKWAASSFMRCVEAGWYDSRWGCVCGGRRPDLPRHASGLASAGE